MQQQQTPYGHQFGVASPFDQSTAGRSGPPKTPFSVGSPAAQGTVDQKQMVLGGGLTATSSRPLIAGPGGGFGEKMAETGEPRSSTRSQEESAQATGQQQSQEAAGAQGRSAPEIVAVEGALQNLESHNSTVLCIIGKDIVREVINQSMEFFKVMKQLQLQAVVQQQQQLLAVLRQNADKQERLQKYISMLFTRLCDVCKIIDERFTFHVPADVSAQDLIPFTNEESPALNELCAKQQANSALIELKVEHSTKKRILEGLLTDLDQIMASLHEAAWDISTVMNAV